MHFLSGTNTRGSKCYHPSTMEMTFVDDVVRGQSEMAGTAVILQLLSLFQFSVVVGASGSLIVSPNAIDPLQ